MELRKIPSVERVLGTSALKALLDANRRDWVVDLIRQALDEARASVMQGNSAPKLEEVAEAVLSRAKADQQDWPSHVINATGVILHTNLGRAPLSDDALQAMRVAALGYSNLEMDMTEGRRGSRQVGVIQPLCQLTGADAALVVNNNAAAVLLGLTALAQGKEVIVSRGEAVEIGGGFRIPDVMRQSGATLVEVGTTNRTYASDYESAIAENTAALLKVHASNFRITGFIHFPTIEGLVELGRSRGVLVLHDLGSGCLLETGDYGLAHEPMPQESIAAGVDAAFFSGDKLLGGPQAGIVVGRASVIERLAKHPLARALRPDKLTLAALRATLIHYLRGEPEKVPVWRMIGIPEASLKERAQAWKAHIGDLASVERSQSTIGGGSLPGETLPTWTVALTCLDVTGGAEGLAQRLRAASPPVVGRIQDDRLLLDPRTVLPEEESHLIEAVKAALRG
jgi:L-seryl-tRNA(Ser) seleniumtransferase